MITAEEFTAAVAEFSRPIFRYLRRRGASWEVAEEILLETWARSWAKREQYRGESLRNWLFVIAGNLLAYSHRPHCRQPGQLSDYYDVGYLETFDRQIEAHQVLARCGERDAERLRRRYFDDQPAGTRLQRVRLTRARAAARRAVRF